ncbi:445_t:CDS:10, partial [Ambispora gerdemannii]
MSDNKNAWTQLTEEAFEVWGTPSTNDSEPNAANWTVTTKVAQNKNQKLVWKQTTPANQESDSEQNERLPWIREPPKKENVPWEVKQETLPWGAKSTVRPEFASREISKEQIPWAASARMSHDSSSASNVKNPWNKTTTSTINKSNNIESMSNYSDTSSRSSKESTTKVIAPWNRGKKIDSDVDNASSRQSQLPPQQKESIDWSSGTISKNKADAWIKTSSRFEDLSYDQEKVSNTPKKQDSSRDNINGGGVSSGGRRVLTIEKPNWPPPQSRNDNQTDGKKRIITSSDTRNSERSSFVYEKEVSASKSNNIKDTTRRDTSNQNYNNSRFTQRKSHSHNDDEIERSKGNHNSSRFSLKKSHSYDDDDEVEWSTSSKGSSRNKKHMSSSSNTKSGHYSSNNRKSSRKEDKGLVLPELIVLEKPEKTGFRAIPILPTQRELLARRPKDLPVNKLVQPYENVDEYLSTHCRLLREDCIRPLREGIQKLRRINDGGKQKTDDDNEYGETVEYVDPATEMQKIQEELSDIRVYEHIQIVGVTFASMGVVHRISFRTKYGEHVTWSQSKRLISGTLIVFTNDNFENMVVGTVVNRPLELLTQRSDLQIEVLFSGNTFYYNWPTNYIMVECTSAYFEAYRHVQKVLQELNPKNLPFKSHFVNQDCNIEPPQYLLRRGHPIYEFKNLEGIKNLEESIGTTKINIRDSWPDYDQLDTTLHMSQYEAISRMLTQRLALIQGPPGTGKTYVGLAAIRLLLENTSSSSLIVIACQTNHALDQFLEGIQEFEPNIIRLGSRSKSEKIIPKTLYNISKTLKASEQVFNLPRKRLMRERNRIENMMGRLCEEISNPCISLDFVKEQGLLSDEQLTSLQQDDWVTSKNYATDEESGRDFIREWLEPVITVHSSKHDAIEHQLAQMDLEGRKVIEAEDDTEIDEELLQIIEAEFQDGQFRDETQTLNGNFVYLRSEEYVDDDYGFLTDKEIKEFESTDDVWSIPEKARAAIHNRWKSKKVQGAQKELEKLNAKYAELCAEIKKERIREDILVLQDARVVGMTTTAAAKNHDLLVNLKPKIIMLEEAAETLEAHIITALTPATEHLILIGDHEQLRPSTAVYELAEKHRLDVSLFERLTGFLPYTRLSEQRRMRPIIRELLTPIYSTVIEDAPNVMEYPDVTGMTENLFFIDHEEEEKNVKDSKSKINEHEAAMCAKLAGYLVKMGYEYSQITILSMYTGQRERIKKLLREEAVKSVDAIKHIKVASVDGFQGEENDIILLSLVRSNPQRVCVALSRAKHGMYIFGNAGQLAEKSDVWRRVLLILDRMNRVGNRLKLICPKHSTRMAPAMTLVSWAGEFPPDGGCFRKCGELMDCGHLCPRDCHAFSHDRVSCREPCLRKLPCGHPCKKECRHPCGPCEVQVEIQPKCGHIKEMPCHELKKGYKCSE